MNAEWLCYVDGQEYGPYTWPQLVQMAAAGNVVPATYVRRNHDSQWYAAEQVPGLFAPAAPINPKLAAHPPGAPRTAPATGVSASGAMKKVSSAKAARPASTSAIGKAQAKSATLTPPSGMPSMQPANVPTTPPLQDLPRGRVASKPTASKPSAPQPVAAAPSAPGQAAWIPVVKHDAPAETPQFPRADSDATHASPAKKPDKSKTLVFALGGAMGGVALLGVLLLVWKMNQKPEETKPVAVAAVEIPTEEIDPTASASESNPTDVAPTPKATNTPSKGTPPSAAQGTEPKAAAAPDASAAAALVSSVKLWKPADTFGKIGVNPGLTCTKFNAWLAADVDGRRVNVKLQTAGPAGGDVQSSIAPAEGDAAETPPIIAAPAAVGGTQFVATEAAPYLFIELTINNPDVKPRPYAGWNSADTTALLVDATGKPFSLVPISATPGVKRLAAKELLPGESVVDTLVFAVPPTGELLFRLALPKPAFSSKQTGAWGYEISGGALAALAAKSNGPGGATAVNPGTTASPPRPAVALPIPGVQEEPKPVAPQPAPPAAEPEMKKPPINPNGPIPIPGLTDEPANNNKPAGPKVPEEVPNLVPPAKKR